MRTDTNERAEIRELSGVASESLRGALCEMEAVASGTRATKPFYHASINTRADEPLTDAQRALAIDRLETALGLSGQSRIVVLHLKEGREHCHIVWSRIDLERMRAISDSHNYRKHEEVARGLEREFGHERVQGAHAEREGKERPERTPSHSEMLQTSRGAVSPGDAKALITELWRQTDNGNSFKAALEDRGWLLARGDRRDFVAIDPQGGTHSLARRIEGARAPDVRDRMADVDQMSLPTVAEARHQQREKLARSHVDMATDAAREELDKRHGTSEPGLEWTDRAGMVAQQESAMRALKDRALRPNPMPAQEPEIGLITDFVTQETKEQVTAERAKQDEISRAKSNRRTRFEEQVPSKAYDETSDPDHSRSPQERGHGGRERT